MYYKESYKINDTSPLMEADIGDINMRFHSKCKNQKKEILIPKYGIPYNELRDNYTYIFDA